MGVGLGIEKIIDLKYSLFLRFPGGTSPQLSRGVGHPLSFPGGTSTPYHATAVYTPSAISMSEVTKLDFLEFSINFKVQNSYFWIFNNCRLYNFLILIFSIGKETLRQFCNTFLQFYFFYGDPLIL